MPSTTFDRTCAELRELREAVAVARRDYERAVARLAVATAKAGPDFDPYKK